MLVEPGKEFKVKRGKNLIKMNIPWKGCKWRFREFIFVRSFIGCFVYVPGSSSVWLFIVFIGNGSFLCGWLGGRLSLESVWTALCACDNDCNVRF